MPESTEEIVLVLESDKDIKKQLKKALSGAEVVFSSSVPRFLAEAKRKRPGVILMDAELPSQDGFKICQQLAVHQATRDIPILYVTGSVDRLEEFGPDADRVISTDDFGYLAQRVEALVSEGRVQKAVLETLATSGWEPEAGLTQHDVGVLESGGFSVDAKFDPEPIAKGAAAYDRLIETSLTVALAAKKLGVTDGRVRQRLLANPAELYGVRKGKTWRLPAFQFGPRELVPNIDRVIVKLDPGLSPASVDRWFRLENVDLQQGDDNLSPLQWLGEGEAWQPVADLAEDL
jgi:CheY-like chemotaxis protein